MASWPQFGCTWAGSEWSGLLLYTQIKHQIEGKKLILHWTQQDIYCIWLEPRMACRSLFKQLEIPPAYIYYRLCTLLSRMRNIFKQIHLFTILVQGISTIFKGQVPTYLVFKKVYFLLA